MNQRCPDLGAQAMARLLRATRARRRLSTLARWVIAVAVIAATALMVWSSN